jgi:flavin-dependent dehydrogenase
LPMPEDLHSRSAGVTAYWGSEMPNHMDYFLHPGQHGVNLCRPRFDADLARAAESFGVLVLRSATLQRAVRDNTSWQVEIGLAGKVDRITAHVIVDATGRLATFSRRQGARLCAHDRQIALVAIHNDATRGQLGTRSIVEATETGWWYAARINSSRGICMLVTDNDLLPRSTDRALHAWWLDQLGRTMHVPRLFRKLANAGNLVARSARSQYLDVEFGPGWIAVGDAAMAYDPLSSQGIAKALGHGRVVAAGIVTYLAGDRQSLERIALDKREYATYQTTRAQYYRLERRWPGSTFWRRRHSPLRGIG